MDYSSATMAVRSIGRFTGQTLTAIAVLRYHLRAMRTAPAAALAALAELDGFEQGLHQVEKWLGRHDVEAAGDAALLSALSRLNGEVQHAWAEIRIWRDDKSLQRLGGGARLNDLAHRFRGTRYRATLVAMARKLAAWRSALSFHLARLRRIYRPQAISKRLTKFEYLPNPSKKEAASPFAPMNSAQTSTPSRSSGGGGDGDGGSATSTSSSRGSSSRVSRISSSSSTRSSGFSSRPSKGGQTSTKPSGTMGSREGPSSSSAASRRRVRKTSSQFFQQRYHWTCDALYGIDDAFEHHGADGVSLCGFCGFKFYWTDDECFARQGRHLVKRHGFGRCGRDVGFASKKNFTRHLVATHKMVVRDFHQGSPVDFADDSWLDRFFRRWGEAPLLPRTAAAAAAAASPVRRHMTTTPDDDDEDDSINSTKNNTNNDDVAGIGNNNNHHHHHSNNSGGGGTNSNNSSSTEPQSDTADALTTLKELAAVLQEAGLAPSLRLRAPRGELTGHPWLQPAYVSALCTSLAKLDDEETVAALGEDRFADVCYVAACLAEDLAVAGHEDLLALEGYLSPAHDVVNRVVVAGEAPDRYRAAHRLNTGWEMLVDDGHGHGHGGGGGGDTVPRRFRTLLDAVRHRCRTAGTEQPLSQTSPKSIVRILESARASVMRSSNGYLMRQRRLGRALTSDNLRRLPGLDSRSDGRQSQRIDDWLLGIFVHSIPLRRILMSGMVVPELATADPCSWAAFLLEHWDDEPVDTRCDNQAGGGYASLLDSPSSGYFSFGATIGES